MGWTTVFGSDRKAIIGGQTQNWQRGFGEYTLVATCLAKCYRGGPGAGILWTVWEHRYVSNDDWSTEVKPRKRFIGCDLFQYRKNDGWSFKEMSECMGPCYYSCPMKYLSMVPEVTSSRWRAKVCQWNSPGEKARRKEMRGR
jgi:hypothetical protein